MDSSLERELKQYQKRKAKAQDKGDLDEESKLCYAAAELLTQYGFYGDAVKEYKQALQVSEAKEDTIGSAVAHRMVGECLCALGKYKDALFHQNLHLQLAKSSSNLVEQQRAWATIGRTWFVYSDSALDTAETEESLLESQKAYLESLSICDELQGIISETELLEMRSRLFLNLGLVYDSKNDSQSARKFIDKALHIAREQNLQETEFRCHYCIGGVLMKIGLDAQAQNAFEKAVKAARKNNKKLDEADALVQLGQVHLKMGDFLLARRTLKIAYKISPSQASGDMEGLKSNLVSAIKGLKLLNKLNELSEGKESEQVKILDALGDLYSNVKAFPKALEFYDKELDVAKSIGLSPSKLSPIYVSLAITYTDLGQPKKAVQCYMDELETIDGNYKGMCDTWCNVAQVHENAGADYDEVEKAYLIALTYAEKANKVPIQIRVNKCLADTQKKYQNMKLYAETMKKIEELESEFGIEEESDEEDKEHIEIDDNNEEEEEDDDSIIEREMLLPDSDEDDENEDSNDESVIKHRTRSSARAKLSKKNEKGETPLHRAAIAGDTELVRRLIDQGADINTRDYCGWQPLHEACNHGYTEIVRILLAKGANVNDPGGSHCQGVTPLHDAAQNGHIDIVKLLVENGASLLNKDVRGCTPLDAVIEAQESEEDEDLIGCETEAVSGRKAVEKYLKRISLGQPSSSKILKKQPEMRRRNRLFFDNNDSGNDDDDDDDDDDYDVDGDDDDDDDDDDVRVPSLSRFNTKSQTKRKGESRKHPISPLDSDDDEDIPVPKNRESRVSNDSSADFPPKRSRNECRKTSKSPSRQTTSSKSPLRQNSSSKNDIDCEEERRSASENEDDFHVEVEDESSCSPINYDSEVKETNTRLLNESREQSFDTEGISVVDSTDWQSSDQYTSLTYVDTISGKRANANGSRNTTPALISERELGSTAVTSANDESVWLIDDLPERPTKRRRKQATLSASLVLSRRGPTTYRTRTPRNNSVSSSSRRASRPKQTRLEVRRTPSPTYLNCSPTSHHNHHGNDNSANAPFQSHSSGPSSQGDSTERQISVTSNPGGAPPMRVRVQVQGKTFLIPCPEKSDQDRKTISWLAEQAKLRYFSAFGLRPVLALQTSEGAFLSPEDKISDVLSNNEQIVASLESWDLPPLAERYKTACISSNCSIKKEVQAVLQAEPQISVISLGNLALKACHVLPLARALQCHDRLVKLILPGNKIGDSGVQHIASSLSTLPNLAVLDLQSNGITHKGITYLSNALSKYNDLQEITSSSKLEELDIAYNALYDTCGSPLANIILTCSQLSSLRLQSCCLTSKAVDLTKPLAEALKASRLRYLSVAHNVLGGQGLHDLLLAFPCHVLRHLDVTSTVVNKSNVTMAIEGLVRYMDKEDCALQNLNLGDCCLGTQDLERLTETRCFRDVLHTLDVSCNYIGNDASHVLTRVFDSKTLASLNLSSNSGITADSLKLILESHSRSSSRLQYINLSSCDIDSPITNDILKLLTKHITKTPCLLELDLSFCPLNQTDRMKIADVWKSNGCDDRQVIVQESYCLLSTNKN